MDLWAQVGATIFKINYQTSLTPLGANLEIESLAAISAQIVKHPYYFKVQTWQFKTVQRFLHKMCRPSVLRALLTKIFKIIIITYNE